MSDENILFTKKLIEKLDLKNPFSEKKSLLENLKTHEYPGMKISLDKTVAHVTFQDPLHLSDFQTTGIPVMLSNSKKEFTTQIILAWKALVEISNRYALSLMPLGTILRPIEANKNEKTYEDSHETKNIEISKGNGLNFD